MSSRQIETQEAPIRPRSFKVFLVDVGEEGSAGGEGEWREGAGAGATATPATAPRHRGRGEVGTAKPGVGEPDPATEAQLAPPP